MPTAEKIRTDVDRKKRLLDLLGTEKFFTQTLTGKKYVHLKTLLDTLSEDIKKPDWPYFTAHVTVDRSDFATEFYEKFKDTAIAESLGRIKHPKDMIAYLRTTVRAIEKKRNRIVKKLTSLLAEEIKAEERIVRDEQVAADAKADLERSQQAVVQQVATAKDAVTEIKRIVGDVTNPANNFTVEQRKVSEQRIQQLLDWLVEFKQWKIQQLTLQANDVKKQLDELKKEERNLLVYSLIKKRGDSLATTEQFQFEGA